MWIERKALSPEDEAEREEELAFHDIFRTVSFQPEPFGDSLPVEVRFSTKRINRVRFEFTPDPI